VQYVRSPEDELDFHIFKLFDLSETKEITLEEMEMMLINFPDMGFSSSGNVNMPDVFYQNIKEQVVSVLKFHQSLHSKVPQLS